MAFHYRLRVASPDRVSDYPTFDEAFQAIAASLSSDDDWWELIRTSDGPDAWTDVLCGEGPPGPGARLAPPRHYPPSH